MTRMARFLAVLAVAVTVLSGCSGVTERDDTSPIVIAGGGVSGVYYRYGQQLATVLRGPLRTEVAVAETAGSVDNLRRIAAGDAMLGFTQSDAVADAVRGVGAFAEPLPIQALARLYDEYVHVIVRRDSGISDVAELSGRTVSLGAPGSGVTVAAHRILAASGVDDVIDRELDLAASIDALENRQIDGFFWVGGVPTPAVSDLAETTPLRLVSVSTAALERINAEHPGVYRFGEFPVSAYGWAEPAESLVVPNYLVTAEGTSPELVRTVLEALFDSRTRLAQTVPAAALLDRRSAVFTDSIALHPGAEAYYRDTKQ